MIYVFFGLFCRGIFFDGLSMVEFKFPCLVCGLVHGRNVFSGFGSLLCGFCMLGDASGRFGCCPVGFGCCGTRDACVVVLVLVGVVFGVSWWRKKRRSYINLNKKLDLLGFLQITGTNK